MGVPDIITAGATGEGTGAGVAAAAAGRSETMAVVTGLIVK